MDDLLVATLFDWDPSGPRWLQVANRLLGRLHGPFQLRPQLDARVDMTTIEQRVSLFHLLSQALFYGVKGDVVELGTFTGKTAVLLRKVMDNYSPQRELHVYDSFEAKFGDKRDI